MIKLTLLLFPFWVNQSQNKFQQALLYSINKYGWAQISREFLDQIFPPKKELDGYENFEEVLTYKKLPSQEKQIADFCKKYNLTFEQPISYSSILIFKQKINNYE